MSFYSIVVSESDMFPISNHNSIIYYVRFLGLDANRVNRVN